MGKLMHSVEFFELEIGRHFIFTQENDGNFPIEFYGIVWLKITDDKILSTAPFSKFPDPVYLGVTCDEVYPITKGYVNPLV